MSTSPHTIFNSRLLPVGWYKAPWTYKQIDAKDTFLFLLLNIALGTCGIWFPVVFAALGPGEPGKVFSELLAAGAAYLFAIPFLASITYAVIDCLDRTQEGGTRKQYVVYIVILFILCVLVSFLISTQFVHDPGSPWPRYLVQGAITLFATLAGVYIFYLLRIDTSQSIPDDIDKRAKSLTTDAQSATSNRGDFE